MSTISTQKTVTTGITVGSGAYTSPLTITNTGAVTNTGSGYVLSSVTAVTVVNAGYILSVNPFPDLYAINLFTHSYLENSGTIKDNSSYGGIDISIGTLVNSGSILLSSTASRYGVKLPSSVGGSYLHNLASGYITIGVDIDGLAVNAGTIVDADGNGIASTFTYAFPDTIVNTGTISGSGSGPAYGFGVILRAGGTVVNSGTITGANGTAVAFQGTAANRLVLDPGYKLGGIVTGSSTAGATNTLELASAAGTGTVSGLGTQFVNFGTITVDSGATWTLGGSNAIGGGVTLVDYGALAITAAQTIGGGQIELRGGGLTDAAGLVVNSGALTGAGTVSATTPISGSGGIIATGGTLDLGGAIAGSATGLQIANGANTLELDSTVAAGATITFEGALGTLRLTDFSGENLTGFSGTVAGMAVGASATVPTTGIDLTGVTEANVTSAAVSGTSIVVKEGAATVASLSLNAAPPANTYVDWITDGGSGTEIFLSSVACFCRGTLILTAQGEVAVEALAIGDRVRTQSGEARPIKWIGRRAYDSRFVAGNRAVLPIRIEAGALADGVPARDLLLSPEHALHIDGVLLPAHLLVNDATIRQVEEVERLEYFHIELDAHDVIFADGAAAETFVDCDNRGMFQNAHEYAALYPDDRPDPWQFCAERAEPGSPELTWVRAALLARAEDLGWVSRDADLHLIVDGAAVRPVSIEDRTYRFAVPAGARGVLIASRSVVPAETEAASPDERRLGVAVEQIALQGDGLRIAITPDYPALCAGFHDDEGAHRWSDGRGSLPPGIANCFAGEFFIEVRIAETELHYPSEARVATTTSKPDSAVSVVRPSRKRRRS